MKEKSCKFGKNTIKVKKNIPLSCQICKIRSCNTYNIYTIKVGEMGVHICRISILHVKW